MDGWMDGWEDGGENKEHRFQLLHPNTPPTTPQPRPLRLPDLQPQGRRGLRGRRALGRVHGEPAAGVPARSVGVGCVAAAAARREGVGVGGVCVCVCVHSPFTYPHAHNSPEHKSHDLICPPPIHPPTRAHNSHGRRPRDGHQLGLHHGRGAQAQREQHGSGGCVARGSIDRFD